METMARRRDRAPGGRDAHGVRAAVGAGRPRRHVRLCRLPHQPAVRLAARQADRLTRPRRTLTAVAAKAYRALCEFKIAGVPTNVAVPPEPAASSGAPGRSASHGLRRGARRRAARGRTRRPTGACSSSRRPRRGASAPGSIRDDPLAVLALGKSAPGSSDDVAADAPEAPDAGEGAAEMEAPENTIPVAAPMQGTIVSVTVREGETRARRRRGAGHGSDEDGARDPGARQRRSSARSPSRRGDTVFEGHAARLHRGDVARARGRVRGRGDRPRRPPSRPGRGASRGRPRPSTPRGPDAVARRRKTGQRTVRENIDELCDAGSFVEYGSLVIAARRQRNTVEELIDTHAGGRAGHGRGPRERAPVPGHERRAAS